MSIKLENWGKYPFHNAYRRFDFENPDELKKILNDYQDLIPFGNGRSYGDSALSKNMIDTRNNRYFLGFDDTSGLLHAQSGILLSDILDTFVPRGWFLKIAPGTKLITLGGAIASDVHGKNHHKEGCFSECIKEMNIMFPSGETITCSKHENSDLFRATCGGMGLTGVILDAKIYLKKIKSPFIKQKLIKTKNLAETFEQFEKQKGEPYSVAWIDCLSKGNHLGRCHLMVGDFEDNKPTIQYQSSKAKLGIPFNIPSIFLNHYSVQLFNQVYYNRILGQQRQSLVNFDSFFFPLDSISHWNRLYGKNGFTQYQFILPKASSFKGLEEILNLISKEGAGSFLAVLKLYGKQNPNYLSFPMEGYSLALDFKMSQNTLNLLDKLDQLVLKHEGRIYLAKDVRVSRDVFEKGYEHISKFRQFRRDNRLQESFNSIQSKRLGI